MNRHRDNTFRKAFSITIPVLMGYTAIGLAFGLLVIHSGFPWYLAPLTGIIIFAGAMQFLTLGILNPLVAFPELAFITFFVNARHSVYGLSMLDRYNASGKYRPYLIYALTDETYGLLTSALPPEIVRFIEQYIPPMVMVILVIYSFRLVDWLRVPHGIPETLGAVLTVVLHLWKGNALLSIF